MPKRLKNDGDAADQLPDALTNLARRIDRMLGRADKRVVDGVDLELYRATAPTIPTSCSYEPNLLVVAQGKKGVDLGKAIYSFGETTFLLTSLELPVISRVMVASEEVPYLAFFLKLEIGTLREF